MNMFNLSLRYQKLLRISCLLTGETNLIRNFSSEGEFESINSSNKRDNEEELKTKILNASLLFVNDFGWSKSAIVAGAEAVGYPGVIHGLFQRGGYDLIYHFKCLCNKELVTQLITQVEEGEKDVLLRKSEREMMENAVMTHLKMILPYSSRWPQALAISSLPRNANFALANLLTLVDDICYYSGDRSVDMTWYTKRVGLGLIYKMTETYMLSDSSECKERTWDFLHRRMDEASQLKSLAKSSEQAVSFTRELGMAAFITARNLLGMNLNR